MFLIENTFQVSLIENTICVFLMENKFFCIGAGLPGSSSSLSLSVSLSFSLRKRCAGSCALYNRMYSLTIECIL